MVNGDKIFYQNFRKLTSRDNQHVSASPPTLAQVISKKNCAGGNILMAAGGENNYLAQWTEQFH